MSRWLSSLAVVSTTKAIMLRSVLACLNWAVGEGILPYSPLARMKVGQMHGRERILSKEERQQVLAAVKSPTLKLFLRFLEQTGARPYSEAAQIEADMIDWEEGCIPLKKHKNARKGKKRVIYLTEDESNGKLYRFVPTTWGDLSAGTLQVLVAGSGTSGSFSWANIPDPDGSPTQTRSSLAASAFRVSRSTAEMVRAARMSGATGTSRSSPCGANGIRNWAVARISGSDCTR